MENEIIEILLRIERLLTTGVLILISMWVIVLINTLKKDG